MTDDALLCLVYVSRAVVPMGDAELLSLLRQARAANSRVGITGLLLFRHGRFMQALEGPNHAVHGLYSRICLDPRHTDVTTLIKFRPEGRAFAGWSMGFAHVDRIPESDRAGFSSFLQDDFDPAHWTGAPHRAVRLLQAFKEVDNLVEV
ncbi:BLUF domain-containing protein [Rhodospirillum centenum]|uniref:Sensors of blue-light using FAD, putative n=1 Tax=Rhodospirillum centenum (strain ATCC 51521 / SW) TaxID=414684 RepID=B6IP78_RHOCS|nr:BLUF domain-containing protein [Rhodospirillum centenum]ACI99580.1 sensors of blue-light using FAD, putative [Rhodospirillum centenum SW]